MSTDGRLRLFVLLIFLFFSFSLQANPFLGSQETEQPAVRPPSSGGFMVETQLKFREMLGEKLEGIRTGRDPVLFFSIMGLAFLYGVLHAAGPGHRKTVIFSLFLTRKARVNEPLLASLVAAGVHGGTAVFLILVFRLIFTTIRSDSIQNVSLWMEGISYSLLMVLALWFLIRSGKHHHHKNEDEFKGNIYSTLAVSSLFPCPGVIMIMTFSVALDVLNTGIPAVISLSAGMGLTISLVAYMAYFGREGLFRILKKKEKLVASIGLFLERISYIFLFLFSFWMIYPFIQTLF